MRDTTQLAAPHVSGEPQYTAERHILDLEAAGYQPVAHGESLYLKCDRPSQPDRKAYEAAMGKATRAGLTSPLLCHYLRNRSAHHGD
ncbi:MAG: hypothetical protein AAF468_19275 [Pseudomonadota bacterium]